MWRAAKLVALAGTVTLIQLTAPDDSAVVVCAQILLVLIFAEAARGGDVDRWDIDLAVLTPLAVGVLASWPDQRLLGFGVLVVLGGGHLLRMVDRRVRGLPSVAERAGGVIVAAWLTTTFWILASITIWTWAAWPLARPSATFFSAVATGLMSLAGLLPAGLAILLQGTSVGRLGRQLRLAVYPLIVAAAYGVLLVATLVTTLFWLAGTLRRGWPGEVVAPSVLAGTALLAAWVPFVFWAIGYSLSARGSSQALRARAAARPDRSYPVLLGDLALTDVQTGDRHAVLERLAVLREMATGAVNADVDQSREAALRLGVVGRAVSGDALLLHEIVLCSAAVLRASDDVEVQVSARSALLDAVDQLVRHPLGTDTITRQLDAALEVGEPVLAGTVVAQYLLWCPAATGTVWRTTAAHIGPWDAQVKVSVVAALLNFVEQADVDFATRSNLTSACASAVQQTLEGVVRGAPDPECRAAATAAANQLLVAPAARLAVQQWRLQPESPPILYRQLLIAVLRGGSLDLAQAFAEATRAALHRHVPAVASVAVAELLHRVCLSVRLDPMLARDQVEPDNGPLAVASPEDAARWVLGLVPRATMFLDSLDLCVPLFQHATAALYERRHEPASDELLAAVREILGGIVALAVELVRHASSHDRSDQVVGLSGVVRLAATTDPSCGVAAGAFFNRTFHNVRIWDPGAAFVIGIDWLKAAEQLDADAGAVLTAVMPLAAHADQRRQQELLTQLGGPLGKRLAGLAPDDPVAAALDNWFVDPEVVRPTTTERTRVLNNLVENSRELVIHLATSRDLAERSDGEVFARVSAGALALAERPEGIAPREEEAALVADLFAAIAARTESLMEATPMELYRLGALTCTRLRDDVVAVHGEAAADELTSALVRALHAFPYGSANKLQQLAATAPMATERRAQANSALLGVLRRDGRAVSKHLLPVVVRDAVLLGQVQEVADRLRELWPTVEAPQRAGFLEGILRGARFGTGQTIDAVDVTPLVRLVVSLLWMVPPAAAESIATDLGRLARREGR